MIWQDVNFFYNKKSPMFLVEIVTLITTWIVRQYKIDDQAFNRLTLVILIGAISQILLKSIGVMVAKKLCQKLNFQALIIVLFLLYHIGLLIYSIILYNNSELRARYASQQPHFYYLKAYVYTYSILIFGSMGLFILLLIITVLFAGRVQSIK